MHFTFTNMLSYRRFFWQTFLKCQSKTFDEDRNSDFLDPFLHLSRESSTETKPMSDSRYLILLKICFVLNDTKNGSSSSHLELVKSTFYALMLEEHSMGDNRKRFDTTLYLRLFVHLWFLVCFHFSVKVSFLSHPHTKNPFKTNSNIWKHSTRKEHSDSSAIIERL